MKMTTKKTLMLFVMAICVSMLGLVIKSRIKLSEELIVGGAENAFVEANSVKDALEDYDRVGDIHIVAPEGLTYPHIDIEDWHYMLANKDNSIYRYEPQLKMSKQEGIQFYNLAVDMLDSMLSAAESEGFTPYIGCSYLSYNYQQQAYDEKVQELVSGGYGKEEAEEVARKFVPYPGTNEHQTGLAIDIYDKYYDEPDYSDMDPEFFKWMDEHCYKYGFIKRYPSELKTLTGFDEPWHYRFVGKEVAAFIMQNDLCLEQLEAYYK